MNVQGKIYKEMNDLEELEFYTLVVRCALDGICDVAYRYTKLARVVSSLMSFCDTSMKSG